MLRRLAQRLVRVLLTWDRKEPTEEEKEILDYGMECFLADALQILLVVIIGILMGQLWTALLYAVSFGFLKGQAGGYHAKTHFECLAIFTTGLLVALIICQVTPASYVLGVASFSSILTSVLLLVFAPISHPNNPKTVERQLRHRKLCLFLAMALPVMIPVLTRLSGWVGLPLALGFVGASLTLPFAKGGETAWKKTKD